MKASPHLNPVIKDTYPTRTKDPKKVVKVKEIDTSVNILIPLPSFSSVTTLTN